MFFIIFHVHCKILYQKSVPILISPQTTTLSPSHPQNSRPQNYDPHPSPSHPCYFEDHNGVLVFLSIQLSLHICTPVYVRPSIKTRLDDVSVIRMSKKNLVCWRELFQCTRFITSSALCWHCTSMLARYHSITSTLGWVKKVKYHNSFGHWSFLIPFDSRTLHIKIRLKILYLVLPHCGQIFINLD